MLHIAILRNKELAFNKKRKNFCKKYRDSLKKASDYIVPGVLLNTHDLKELFFMTENPKHEVSDDESIIFESENDESSTDDESDLENEDPL